MSIRQIRTDSQFDKKYKKLPSKVKDKAIVKEKFFRDIERFGDFG